MSRRTNRFADDATLLAEILCICCQWSFESVRAWNGLGDKPFGFETSPPRRLTRNHLQQRMEWAEHAAVRGKKPPPPMMKGMGVKAPPVTRR